MTRIRTVQRFSSDGSLSAIYTLREARVLDTLTGALEPVYIPSQVSGSRRTPVSSTIPPIHASTAVPAMDERLAELINAFRVSQRGQSSSVPLGTAGNTNIRPTSAVRREPSSTNTKERTYLTMNPSLIHIDVTDVPLASMLNSNVNTSASSQTDQ